MATTADIKIGMCIELDGKTFQIVDFQHVKPGKGPAFVRTKLKNLENGRVLENTFSAGAKIEPVRVERRPYQFTYEDDLGAHFMHTETFEEINIDKNLIDNYDLMADGQIVEVMFHTEKESVLSAELPPIVDMEVTYTEPGIKGDTASTNSLKPATVNTGATIKVPLFINTGDKIRVDTRTREYYERIKYRLPFEPGFFCPGGKNEYYAVAHRLRRRFLSSSFRSCLASCGGLFGPTAAA